MRNVGRVFNKLKNHRQAMQIPFKFQDHGVLRKLLKDKGWNHIILMKHKKVGINSQKPTEILLNFICFRFPVVVFASPGISNCHTARCSGVLVFASSKKLNHNLFTVTIHCEFTLS